MSSFNLVVLMGNLTREPELKYLPKGTAVCEIGLAVNRITKTESGEKRETVTFVDVTLFGRTAEIVGEYCKKGNPLHVSGRLSLDQWTDKETGKKRSKLKIIGENIQLLGGKRDDDEGKERDDSNKRVPRGSTGGRGGERPPTRPPKPPADPDLDDEDRGEIPF